MKNKTGIVLLVLAALGGLAWLIFRRNTETPAAQSDTTTPATGTTVTPPITGGASTVTDSPSPSWLDTFLGYFTGGSENGETTSTTPTTPTGPSGGSSLAPGATRATDTDRERIDFSPAPRDASPAPRDASPAPSSPAPSSPAPSSPASPAPASADNRPSAPPPSVTPEISDADPISKKQQQWLDKLAGDISDKKRAKLEKKLTKVPG